MKSYYYEGKGLPDFLKELHVVKETITNYFSYEHGFHFKKNLSEVMYVQLINNVCEKSQELFNRDKEILFRIEILMPQKQLFIRIKNSKKEIITILTIYFSRPLTEIELHCVESAKWSNDAFRYALRE